MKTENKITATECLEKLRNRTTTTDETVKLLEAIPYPNNVISSYCIQAQRDEYIENIKPMIGIVEYAVKNLKEENLLSAISLVLNTCGNRNMPTVFEHVISLNDRKLLKIITSNPFVKSEQLERISCNKFLSIGARKEIVTHRNVTYKTFKQILHGNGNKADEELEILMKKHTKYRQLVTDYVKAEYEDEDNKLTNMPFSWIEELAFNL